MASYEISDLIMSTQDHQRVAPARKGLDMAFVTAILVLVVLLFVPAAREYNILAATPAVSFFMGIILSIGLNIFRH
jgi:hypothetical protein